MGTKTTAFLIAMLVLPCFGAAPAQALGRHPFQVLLNAEDGSGRIFMNDGSKPSWKACTPDLTACTPFATGNFNTGDAPAGTVFWAGGELITPTWQGNVRPTAVPSVRGTVRGNEVVTPVAGAWSGGWADDYDSITLSICRTAAGEHCLEVNHEGRREDCGSPEATLIDPAFAGRYLRVVDRRYGSGTVFIGVGHPPYYPIEEIDTGPTVSMAVVGKIGSATGPPKVDCGPGSLFRASIAADGSAKATCMIIGCRVVLIARRGEKEARIAHRLPPAPFFPVPFLRSSQWGRFRLGPSVIERLGRGPIRIAVKINGMTAARRTVKIGRLPVVAEYPERTARS